jgi:hypothetical protein
MTRSELRVLSEVHAMAMAAMVAPQTQSFPMDEALRLLDRAAVDRPGLAPDCHRFVEALRDSRGAFPEVALAGRALRDATLRALAFVPVDLARVDIHG